MRAVFADTVGLLALWDKADQWHDVAEQAYQHALRSRVHVYTTSFVMIECANASARKPYRLEVDRLRILLERGGYLIHPTAMEWSAAWHAYARSEAQGAGVVDQVSFLVMRRLDMTQAFTNDRHFRAAGFELLF